MKKYQLFRKTSFIRIKKEQSSNLIKQKGNFFKNITEIIDLDKNIAIIYFPYDMIKNKFIQS